MLQLWWRRLSVVLLFLVVAACSGGGCSSGCAGCGVTPLPGGFPKPSVITNAASLRVTRQGLDFLGDNLGTIAGKLLPNGQNGIISFNVPSSTTTQKFGPFNITIKLCPGGANANVNPKECVAEVNLAGAKLHLDAANYSTVNGEPALRISGTLPLRVQDLPVNLTALGDFGIGIGQAGNPKCQGGVPNGPNGLGFDYFDFPIEVLLPLISETIAPRDGYTKIDVKNAVINPQINKNNIALCKDCGVFNVVCDTLTDFIKNLVFNQLVAPLKSQIKNLLESQLCTKPQPTLNPQCPTGSQPDANNAKCVYISDPATCVPTQLGTDGHIDLSGLLSKISPGTGGGLDFVFAAGGDMMPSSAAGTNTPPDGNGNTPNGMTLGLLGGALPMPQSNCVPLYDNKIPVGIPIPDEMMNNTLTPWPMNDKGPDLGIALSGRYLNFAFGSVYNSGLLCLGVSTEQFAQLQSGLLSVLIPGMKTLTFEQKAAPVAIVTRPQQAPIVKIGTGKDVKTDPLLLITLKQFSIDFYVWSLDRFIRAFTFTGEISLPINLSTAVDAKTNPNGGLLPVLGGIIIAPGATLSNNDLLVDDPALVAGSISSLLGGIAGQFLGALKPVDLSNSLAKFGMGMTIPDGGIRKLSKDTDDFIGLFANLALAKGNAGAQADVQAKLTDKIVHPEAMSLTTASRDKLPELHVTLSSSLDNGSHFVEYSYTVDEGTRSAWAQNRNLVVKDDSLFLQGKHVLHVFAREVGNMQSESVTPADVPFTIDVLAPMLKLEKQADAVSVQAWDIVSADDKLLMRSKTAGDFSPWTSVHSIPIADLNGASSITVEVKDEEGNVASQSQGLVRGRDDGTTASGGGCGCVVPSTKAGNWAYGIPGLAGILALGWRRRRSTKRAASEVK